MDVGRLYPNKPHGEALASLRKFLETRYKKQIVSDTLAELAEVVLKNNIFEFDGKTFKLKRGAAIGTKFAPPYAILFTTDFERKMLESFEKKTNEYIDDILFIWEHGEESLRVVFVEQVNMFHPTLKFTAEYSEEKVNCLDVKIKLIHGKRKTALFVNPTDTHQFLDPASCHPYHCKKGIPNITYYPVFQNVRGRMEELHISLTSNKEHKQVFPNVPVVGFGMSIALMLYPNLRKVENMNHVGKKLLRL